MKHSPNVIKFQQDGDRGGPETFPRPSVKEQREKKERRELFFMFTCSLASLLSLANNDKLTAAFSVFLFLASRTTQTILDRHSDEPARSEYRLFYCYTGSD